MALVTRRIMRNCALGEAQIPVFFVKTGIFLFLTISFLFGSVGVGQAISFADIPTDQFQIVDEVTDVAELPDGQKAYKVYSAPRLLYKNNVGDLEVRPAGWNWFHEMGESKLSKTGEPGYKYKVSFDQNSEIQVYGGNLEKKSGEVLSQPEQANFFQATENYRTLTTFENIYPNVDVRFQDVKKLRYREIILKQKFSNLADSESLIFWEHYTLPLQAKILDIRGNTLLAQESYVGDVLVSLPDGSYFLIGGAVVGDAQGADTSRKILSQKIKIDTKNNTLAIGIELDGAYLNDSKRVYPVIIDPQYDACKEGTNTRPLNNCRVADLYLRWHNNNNTTANDLYLGYTNDGAPAPRQIVTYFDLSSLPASEPINVAFLRLTYDRAGIGTLDRARFSVKRINQSWNTTTNGSGQPQTTLTYNDIWDQLLPVSGANAWVDINYNQGRTVGWNVTEAVEAWQNQSWPNYGLLVQNDQGWNKTGGVWNDPSWPDRIFIFKSSRDPADNGPYLAIVTDPPLPDLNIWLSSATPTSVTGGTMVNLTTEIRNIGSSGAGNFRLGYYLSADNTFDGSDTLLGSDNILSVDANTISSQINKSVTIPSGLVVGQYYILFVVDDQAVITELNETNNTAGVGITVTSSQALANLIINSSSVDPTSVVAGDTFIARAEVKNIGTRRSLESTMAYYLSMDAVLGVGDIYLGNNFVSSIASNRSSDVSEQLEIPVNTASGNYYIIYKADVYNDVEELDENDNVGSTSIIITAPTNQADVSIENLTIQNSNAVHINGDTLSLQARLQNLGNVVANNVEFRVRLRDTQNPNDYYTLTNLSPAPNFGNWSAGYDQVRTFSGQIPNNIPSQGLYEVEVLLDPSNVIAERSENNNLVISSNNVFVQLGGGGGGSYSPPANPTGDTDGDGQSNLEEAVVGNNQSDANSLVVVSNAHKETNSLVVDTDKVADPVNARTGSFEHTEMDLVIVGRGVPLDFTRVYNSKQTDKNGRFGRGWDFSYNQYYYRDPLTKNIIIYQGGTVASLFTTSDNGVTYQAPPGEAGEVYFNAGGELVYSKLDGIKYIFSSTISNNISFIRYIVDTNNNTLTFAYSYQVASVPLLSKITDASGREVNIVYGNPTGNLWDKIISVEEKSGQNVNRTITYNYDANTNLISISSNQTSGGSTQNFTDTFTHDAQNRIITHTDPRGTTLTNVYDIEGRVIEQYEYNPNIDQPGMSRLVYTLEYQGRDPAVAGSVKCTLVKNFLVVGVFTSERYCYNADELQIYSADRDGNNITQERDARGLIIRRTDQNNHTTQYEYDTERRVTKEILPDTAEWQTEVGYIYEDNFNRLVSQTVTSTPRNNPALTQLVRTATNVIDPQNGNVLARTDYLGFTENFVYDQYGNVLVKTNKNNNQTRYTYDLSGNYRLTESKTVTLPDNTTQTIIKAYTYDEFGNRLSYTDPENNSYIYTYDNKRNLVTETDPLGGQKIYTYDNEDHPVSATNQLGQTTNYIYDKDISASLVGTALVRANNSITTTSQRQYDGVGNLVKEIDANDNEINYVYNNAGRILQKQEPYNTTIYTYDSKGNLIGETNSLNERTDYLYDERDNLTETRRYLDAVNYISSRNIYDGLGRIIRVIDQNSNTTFRNYDLGDRLLSETDALGNVVSYFYDANGNKIGELTARAEINSNFRNSFGHSTTYQYDEANRLRKQINADSKETVYFYDRNNNLVRMIDRQNTGGGQSTHLVNYEYDALNRKIKETDAYGNFTSSTYDAIGNLRFEQDKNGNVAEYRYDDFNRLEYEIDSANNTTQFVYDLNGNRTAVIYPDATRTAYTFDNANRLIAVTDALGGSKYLGYDAVGNKTQETDKLGIITNFQYDRLNRPVITTEAFGTPQAVETVYTYDNNGNKLTETVAGKGVLATTYDDLNRPLVVTNPGGKTESYTYDGNGNIITKTDGKNQVTTYAYDSLDRVTNKHLADNTNITYTYDNWDNVLNTTEPTLTTVQVFDNLNRPSREEQTFADLPNQTKVITRSYDANSNLATQTDASNKTFTYTYDNRNLLDAVVYNGQTLADYSYNSMGRMINTTYANGINQAYTYDTLNRVDILEIKNQANTTLFKHDYDYDAESNRTQVTENNTRTIGYQYDNLEQLRTVNYSDIPGPADLTYTYDTWGNRLTETKPTGQLGYAYDLNSNELTNVSHNQGRLTTTNTYDNNGFLTQEVYTRLGALLRTVNYTWDAQNRLAGITYQDNSRPAFLPAVTNNTVQYSYDDFGNRISKTLNSELRTKTYYINNGLNVLNELGGNGTIQKTMIAGVGELDVQGNITFVHTDVLGSTILLTNSQGEVVAEYEYGPFGLIVGLNEANGNGTDYLYTGQQFDPESELYYYNARYYNPRLGRFISRDTKLGNDGDVLSYNRYIYVKNNPLKYTDPTGGEEKEVNSKNLLQLTGESNTSDPFLTTGDKVLLGATGTYITAGHLFSKISRSVAGKALGAVGFGYELFRPEGAVNASEEEMLDRCDNECYSLPAGVGIGLIGLKKGEEVFEMRQRMASLKFSSDLGVPEHLRGRLVKDVITDLKSGKLTPKDLPVGYTIVDGNNIIINNKSFSAVRGAGLEPIFSEEKSIKLLKQAKKLLRQSRGIIYDIFRKLK